MPWRSPAAAVAVGSAGHDRGRWRTLEFDVATSDFFFQDFGPDGVREVTFTENGDRTGTVVMRVRT